MRAKRKVKLDCAYNGCKKELFAKGCCKTHYFWEKYHMDRGHGAKYFREREEQLEELASRCRQVNPARRKLRLVK